MTCPRTRFLVQGCLCVALLTLCVPATGQQSPGGPPGGNQAGLTWSIPNEGPPDEAPRPDEVLASEAEIVRQHGTDSPERLILQVRGVYPKLRGKEIETAAVMLDKLREKARPLLNDGTPPEKQKTALKGLRSVFMTAAIELAFRRQDYQAVIPAAQEHLKFLAQCEEAVAREVEMRTTMALITALQQRNRGAESMPLIKQVVETARTREFAPTERVAEDFSLIATCALNLGLLEDAVFLAKKSLAMIERMESPDTGFQVAALSRTSLMLLDQDKLQEAEAMQKQAHKLAAEKKIDPRLEADMFDGRGKLELILGGREDGITHLKEAGKHFQAAYDVMARNIDSPGIREGMTLARIRRANNLAAVNEEMGNGEEARTLRKEAWDLLNEALGPDAPQTVVSLSVYVRVLEAVGPLPEARRLGLQMVEKAPRVLGDVDPRVAEMQQTLGRIHTRLGELDDAEKCYERAAGIRERSLGTEHAETAKSYFNLGVVRESKGDFAGAAAYFDHVLKIDRKVYGEKSSVVTDDVNALARNLSKDGQHDAASDRIMEHVNGVEKLVGKDHPDTCGALLILAYVLDSRKRHEEVEQVYNRVIDIRSKALGAETDLVGVARAEYARYLLGQNKLSSASSQVRKAAIIFVKSGRARNALQSSLEIYQQILAKQQYDQATIARHLKSLQQGIDPGAGKAG